MLFEPIKLVKVPKEASKKYVQGDVLASLSYLFAAFQTKNLFARKILPISRSKAQFYLKTEIGIPINSTIVISKIIENCKNPNVHHRYH